MKSWSFRDISPFAVTEAAAMTVGQVTTYNKPVLQAHQSMPSGPVEILANVGVLTAGTRGRVFFNWQSSADGGTTWNSAPSTPHGRTELAGLAPMATYAFRVSVTNGKGPGEWSQSVALFVR